MTRRRITGSVVALVLILVVVVLLLSRCGSSGSHATSNSIVGDWSVTYGAPAVVTIAGSEAGYTMTAKTPVRVTGSSCDLPPATVLARFSRTADGTFTGQHGLWSTATCTFVRWTDLTLVLNGDGHLREVLGKGLEMHDLTRS